MTRLLGWRKTGYWAGTLLAMSVGAWRLHGSFTEYRDGLVVLAGLVLGAHVTQLATAKPAPKEP